METLFQILGILVTLQGNVGRDRCAQLDTISVGESMPDMIGLEVCGTDTALDGTIYYGQARE